MELTQPKRRNRFCLVMCVRDEEPIVERCFESTKHIFDSYFICDTGSADNTIKVMNEWLDDHGKFGTIREDVWKGFGDSKSENLALFRQDSLVSDAEYIMWLDADEVFIKDRRDPLSYLSEEDADDLYSLLNSRTEWVFSFQTLNGNQVYQRWQIARNDRLYNWTDLPTQEMFTSDYGYSSCELSFFFNLARKEGNSSRNPFRYQQDIDGLENYLTAPGKRHYPRARFYLADIYRHNPIMHYRAIELFKEILEKKENWYGENYMACTHLVSLCPDETEKIKYALESLNYDGNRIEAIYYLMKHYFDKQDYVKAYAFGCLAPLNRTNRGFLFFYKDIYNYKFDMDFAYAAGSVGKYQDAWYANRRVNSSEVDQGNRAGNQRSEDWHYLKYKEQINKDI